jgi:hypothetical protein
VAQFVPIGGLVYGNQLAPSNLVANQSALGKTELNWLTRTLERGTGEPGNLNKFGALSRKGYWLGTSGP